MKTNKFEQTILADFPDLFPKDASGNPHCPQGAVVPLPWQPAVYRCLASINEHAQLESVRKKRVPRTFLIRRTFMLLHKAGDRLASMFAPSRKEIQSINMQKPPLRNKIRSWFFYKVFRVSYFFLHHSKKLDASPYVFPQISQIKKKFLTFKIYFDAGHNDFIGGIVFHAELTVRDIPLNR
jgi:hypothetical protein